MDLRYILGKQSTALMTDSVWEDQRERSWPFVTPKFLDWGEEGDTYQNGRPRGRAGLRRKVAFPHFTVKTLRLKEIAFLFVDRTTSPELHYYPVSESHITYKNFHVCFNVVIPLASPTVLQNNGTAFLAVVNISTVLFYWTCKSPWNLQRHWSPYRTQGLHRKRKLTSPSTVQELSCSQGDAWQCCHPDCAPECWWATYGPIGVILPMFNVPWAPDERRNLVYRGHEAFFAWWWGAQLWRQAPLGSIS